MSISGPGQPADAGQMTFAGPEPLPFVPVVDVKRARISNLPLPKLVAGPPGKVITPAPLSGGHGPIFTVVWV